MRRSYRDSFELQVGRRQVSLDTMQWTSSFERLKSRLPLSRSHTLQ